jgi:hypothetical protein
MLARRGAEHEIVLTGEVSAVLEPGEHVHDLGHHRHRTDPPPLRHLLGAVRVVGAHVHQPADKIHIAPAQRQQLALT